MVNRLRSSIFLLIAAILIGTALLPILRVILGIDSEFGLAFNTVVMLLIGGLMSGLTAMILMLRRQPVFNHQHLTSAQDKTTLIKIQACGLLLYTGLPLANFLVGFWLWLRNRHRSARIDSQGREMLNFQVTVYLYLLLSLFLVFIFIGIFTTQIILIFHLITTVIAIITSLRGKNASFPANINVSQVTAKKA